MIELVPYEPDLSDACVALERQCAQGDAYRLSFRRHTFHARAECFDEHGILVALSDGSVAGVMAHALKQAKVARTERRVGFAFDLRVHPAHRGKGLGKQLTFETQRCLEEGGAELQYSYMLSDNQPVGAIGVHAQSRRLGCYRYLVWPVYRWRRVDKQPREADVVEVHHRQCNLNGPFDFYCNPLTGGTLKGHLFSLLSPDAGASVWSNVGLLEEVVERIPWYYRAARSVVTHWPLSRLQWPHIPAPGEALRSWYIFDFFARDAPSARDMMRAISNRALDAGVQFCYVVMAGDHEWHDALCADTPRWCSPSLEYSLMVTGAPADCFENPYVDVRDL